MNRMQTTGKVCLLYYLQFDITRLHPINNFINNLGIHKNHSHKISTISVFIN